MIFSRRFVWGGLLLAAPALLAANERKAPTRPAAAVESKAAYKGAIVIDAATGNVLFEDRADTVSPPASMAKLMTFAVVHDKLASGMLTLSTPVKIAPADAKMGGTQVFLDPRETFPVEELVYAMMIQSANDASHALARVAGGSVEAFVELMNAKARELGMTNTTFRTPHGLPAATRKAADGDLTSPRDFALLGRHLVQKTDVIKYASIKQRKFGEGIRAEPMDMKNHNNILGKVSGVDGLKTGFTNGAGFCLTATAQRNGRRVIVVAMGSADAKTRDLKVSELIERGFAALPVTVASTATAPATPAAKTTTPPPFTPAPVKPGSAKSAAPASTSEPVIKFSIPKK